jgi:hypothetical protein
VGVPQYVGCGEGFVGDGKSRLIEYTPFQDDPTKVAYLVRSYTHDSNDWHRACSFNKTTLFPQCSCLAG